MIEILRTQHFIHTTHNKLSINLQFRNAIVRKIIYNFHFFILLIFAEGVSSPETGKSPIIGNRSDEKNASPKSSSSPKAGPLSPSSPDNWPAQSDEDIDRLVAMHQNRSSLSSLGVSGNKFKTF